jgi:hypothetical protein
MRNKRAEYMRILANYIHCIKLIENNKCRYTALQALEKLLLTNTYINIIRGSPRETLIIYSIYN